ncbi:PREDICTED: bromodomain adjacent to zinc finger domain protein 2B-like isoform X17 [Trachymyrmex septentrionalis]|uniref:bromodomain adjacent to zinc finger domain protein 2B-like isoform X17 n=1 Tax=Trachymyrmex septentrionalis TaxID=34720 RepID=UPI00084EF791|nr:PREDICTED: bromodomain adjacent to zinc finger domain protein 2B-like isoform X17 [Trachymyrmex septentrionalis]
MEKENSASGGGGGGGGGGGAEAAAATPGATSTSEKLQADQANPLLDPTALFGAAYWSRGDSAASSLFGGMPGGYGLGAPHLPSAYAILGRGGSAPGFGGHTPASAPPPSPYPHSSLGTLSVAASQAASLGINPAATAWWTMASHLAAQDYLARLQGAAGLPGFPPGTESLLPPYPASLLNPPSLSSHKSSKSKSSKSHKTPPASSSSSTTPSMTSSSLPVSTQPPVTSSHHSTPVSSTPNSQSNVVSSAKEGSDPSSILGGVRLPPDTEIIKYTSSIVGPKVPGTTNRGRKKTISLDTPSVSVHPPPVPTLSAHQTNTTSSSSLMIEPRKYNRTGTDSNEYRDSVDRVEVIKLPAHSTNGSVLSAPPTYTSSGSSSSNNANNNINDSDAPLNLSLKPATTSSSSPISGSQPLSQLSNLSQSLLASDRTSRRKPGPKPRRVPQNSVPVPASPSPSLAQLFAAADSPQRPSSGSEESESASSATHHKDGRPRNLGRGVSKPKKNTVASLLAQSRALGIKPTPTLDPSVPLSHQVSLLRSNILAAQLHASVATGQSDEKNQYYHLLTKIQKKKRPRPIRASWARSHEKMKNKLLEASGEESNMDVTSESGSNTDVVTDTDDDNAEGTPSAKRRKLKPSERDLQMPLERGWKRETVIKGLGKTGVIKGDVSYYSPCGKTFRSSPDLVKFLEHQNPAELTTANFSFSSRPLVGEFLQPTMGLAEAEFVRLGAQEVARRLEELRAAGGFRDVRTNNQYDREKLAYAKKLAKEEAQRHKEQARLIKEQEKTERLEAVRREREIRNQQLLEERELKRQQAVMLKEQERERRRQHMALVRALENRRKMEEKEKKRLEARAERIATKEKRAEQRRVELELIEQIRKPVEDMELTDHRPLPEVKRIPGLKLSGQAFADIVMVFEFLHNFGETLGFDMESLPSLKSLQLALLNDEEAEEEMLSVMTHLLVCAIEDPGIPQPARHTTGLGQSLRQADITHANISEVLRIYLYANATGEVKALTGVCLERERDKKFADHHQNGGDYASTCSGKNAQFYEHLHNNETWKMSERLRDKPFLALNPTHKAQMLAFLCNELLQNKAVIRQIEGSLETVAQLRKERFVLDTKIRKLRQLHSRKVRMEAVGVIVNKIGDTITIEKKEGEEEGNTTSTAVGTTPTPDEIHHEDEVEDMSENESEGTQPEEEEDKNLSGEELGKKLDKLLKQSEEQLQKLNSSSKQLRAHIFGQDRYWRRYWELACAGGIFVEAMESAEPEVLDLQAELDEKYKNMPIEEKSEVKQEGESKNSENRENVAPNEVKAEKKHNSSEQNENMKSHGDKMKSEEVNCKKEPVQNCGSENVKEEKRNNDVDSTMTDAKTNVTSEEIKQETEVINTDVDMKEEVKKENEETDEDMTKPLVKTMEDKIVETIPNGDKFNHVNNLHNGKELNGSFISIMSIISDNSNAEPNWFSILPRETCDTPGPSTKQIFGIAEPTELRIPIFPPPASPSYDRCDSPAPLILTQDEAAQLEYLKVHGLPPPGEAKPVSKDLRYGWWRITDVDTFQELLEHLHSRGVREKELKRTTWATMESFLAVTGKINVDPGNVSATELQAEPDDPNTSIPKPDNPNNWGEQVALRVDAQLLEQVEALEDKVANASMQVKGWKLPPRAGTEEAEEIEKLNEMEKISAVEQARQRLLSLEAAIERRYLKPPLGVCTGDPNLAALKAEQAAAAANANSNNSEQNNQTPAPPEETTPRGLNTWREATARAHTSAQLAMALYMLEASIAWDKSIMKAVSLTTARNSVCAKLRNRCVSLKATNQYKQLLTTSQTSNCQFCHSGDNEDKLLLCDGCDRGYHTYCFRPKMENIPDGDWYCHECMNKATGERNCLVCGKRAGKNLVLCELCPRAYHTDCHNPVMPKIPRGKWYCSNCHSKQPKKRNSSRRSHTKGGGTRESESSDHPPASPTPSTASNTHVEDVSSSEPPTPTASPRKEGNNRTLTKKQQRELAPCKILLEQLEQQDEAWPFLLPVNTKQFPTYKKIIKTPMDLSTIKKKLQDSAYKSRDEFCADVRQMFINCEVFNEDDSPVGKAGHGMRSFFEMRWTEITGAPPPHPQTHS